MIISFDIDDTLICYDPRVPCESNWIPLFLRPWFGEPLRSGTRSLMKELRRRGCRIWIYTTSYRSSLYLKSFFWLYGIKIEKVINQETHRQWMERSSFERQPSKYPPAFHIDLHVDDLEGVAIEGREHGFSVVVVTPGDCHWTERVLEAAARRTNTNG